MDIAQNTPQPTTTRSQWHRSVDHGGSLMPQMGPVKRRDLIRYLKILGFEGPYSGGKHQFMIKDNVTLRLPNPHKGDIGREFLIRILKQAKIDRTVWERL